MPTSQPRASIDIDAPLERVWEVMLDTAAYGLWNPFVVRADCVSPPVVGARITLHVVFAGGRTARSPERITALDHPYSDGSVQRATLAYVYQGVPARLGLVRGTRWQRLSRRGDGPTRYETVEEFSGPLVRFAGPERVEDGFRRHAAALKARAESRG